MNNDYLRVNSKSSDEDIAVGEFKAEAVQNNTKKNNKKVTLLTLLNYSRKYDPSSSIQTLNTPNLRSNFNIFMSLGFVAVILCFIAFLRSDITMLIFASAISSFIFPVFIIGFCYQLDKTHGVSITEIILGFLFGIGVYFAISLFDSYTNDLVYFSWIQDLWAVIIRDIVLFSVANIFVKIAKKDNMFDAMLLVVSLYAGYMFINSLNELISSLFISVQVNLGSESISSTGAIILGETGFKMVISSFFNSLLYDVLYLSSVMTCCAIVNGGVIGLNVSPIKDENYKEWSLYLLFLLTVILHIAAIFPTSIKLFEIILRSIGVIFSFILAITILNYYVSKSYSGTQKD